MAVYFTSDVHLRLDRPERDRRFARWVNGLEASDTLWIVGDLCDFWGATRQSEAETASGPGLRALEAFHSRGGDLSIIPGNHDLWLGPFYERVLGARFLAEPVDLEVHGLRLRLVHGHRLGARRLWKACMESRAFFAGFARAPSILADPLDHLLEQSNDRGRRASEERHLAVFRRYTQEQVEGADLVIIGHVHRQVDEPGSRPRLVVLGGWHDRANYLRIDASGAVLVSEPDPVDENSGAGTSDAEIRPPRSH